MDTQQIIKDRLKILPWQLQQAIKNPDLSGKFDLVSTRHNLHLDQSNALQTETLLVMLGLEPKKDFIDNLVRSLEISKSDAFSIMNDINKEVFNTIRESLEEIQDKHETTQQAPRPTPPPIPKPQPKPLPTIQTPYKNPITSVQQPTPITPRPAPAPAPIIKPTLEQAGRFTIEKPPVGFSSQYKTPTPTTPSIALRGIEDPETKMIDHLLTTPVVEKEKTEVKKQVVENKPYTVDPYREEF